MNNKKNIDDYFDDNFEVTYTGDLPSIMTTVMTTQTTLTIMKLTTTTMKQTGLLLIMTMIMKKRILIMTAKDQPDGQNGEIPADVPIPLPKNWLLQSGILPAPEVLPLRN